VLLWLSLASFTLLATDAYSDDRFDASLDRRTGFRTRSVLAVPIRDQFGRIVGVLQAINRKIPAQDETSLEQPPARGQPLSYPFSDMDVSVLEILAAHTGSALRKAGMLVDLVSPCVFGLERVARSFLAQVVVGLPRRTVRNAQRRACWKS
jgi:GAF domain-containing protein